MTRTPRLVLQSGGAVLAVLVLLYGALYFIVSSSQFRIWTEAKLSAASDATVRIASLQFHLPLGIVAENVEVSKPEIFSFTTRRLATTFSPLGWFSRTIHRLEVDGPELNL